MVERQGAIQDAQGGEEGKMMGSVTLKFEPVQVASRPKGEVAFLRMPLSLATMGALNTFITKAYGPDCDCTEDPKGWLKIVRPEAKGAR